MTDLAQLEHEFLVRIGDAADERALDEVRVAAWARKARSASC